MKTLEDLFDDFERFAKRRSGGTTTVQSRNSALAEFFHVFAACQQGLDLDWETFLADTLFGYVEAYERFVDDDHAIDSAAPGVGRDLKITLLEATKATEAWERAEALDEKNRIAAAAVRELFNWSDTSRIRAFLYWRTGEIITKSNAESAKSRFLTELAEFIEQTS